MRRVCFECDNEYLGGLECPVCGIFAGEPLADIVEAERFTLEDLEKEAAK